MEVDWEFIGNGIQQIGAMVSNTIVDQYRQKEAEKRFLNTFEKKLRMQEGYDIRANDRNIAKMKELTVHRIGEEKGLHRYKFNWTQEVTANLNSEALLKKREKILTKREPVEMLWVAQLDRVRGKAQRYEDLTDEEETFIEYIDDPIVRTTFQDLQLQKKKYDDAHKLKVLEYGKQMLYLQSTMQTREDVERQRRFQRDKDIGKLTTGIADAKVNLALELKEMKVKKRWKTDKGIWDKEGNVIPKEKELLLQQNPHLESMFNAIDVAERELRKLKDEKEADKGIKIPEADIKALMAEGHTKEEAISIYKQWMSIK